MITPMPLFNPLPPGESLLPAPTPAPEVSRFFSGLDLGQAQDYSALAIVERFTIPDSAREGSTLYRFDVRELKRWPLGTSYVAIVDDLREMYGKPPLAGSLLCIDGTGVGVAVVDMIRFARIGARCLSLTITGGENTSDTGVPKKNLVGAVQLPLQASRLRFADALPLTPVLVKELEAFRVKVTASRHETFEAWRERDHDDLVLALALAVYVASRPAARVTINGEPV